jgi:hypothetical protein
LHFGGMVRRGGDDRFDVIPTSGWWRSAHEQDRKFRPRRSTQVVKT